MGEPMPRGDQEYRNRPALESSRHPEINQRMRESFGIGLTPLERIKVIRKHYSDIDKLSTKAGGVEATPREVPKTSPTVGDAIFRDNPRVQEYREFDRTAASILSLYWLYTGDYNSFTACQPEDKIIDQGNFNKLRDYTRQRLQTFDDLDAMITYMSIADLGKVKNIKGRVREGLRESLIASGTPEADTILNKRLADHDKVLLELLKNNALAEELVPNFARLDQKYKDMIVQGLETGFDLPSFYLGPNIIGSFKGLIQAGGTPAVSKETLDFYMLHSLLDVA